MEISKCTGEETFLNGKYLMKTPGINRAFVYIFAGYERLIRQLCIGGEISLEITERRTSDVKGKKEDEAEYGRAGNIRFRNEELTRELTLKIGYVSKSSMFYAKVGFIKPVASVLEGKRKFCDINKIAPVAYIGITKLVCDNWNANIEIGYQFRQKRNMDTETDTKKVGRTVRFGKGWKIRAGIARAIHL